MASLTSRITFRLVLAILIILALYYVGRPLYWKISATVHDIRHNKQTEAQRSVGWFHDESDSGVHVDRKSAAARRLLVRQIVPTNCDGLPFTSISNLLISVENFPGYRRRITLWFYVLKFAYHGDGETPY
nr:uncharacterized protein LOC109176218 isoform X1 [Ipomoea batatas]